jgi:hypothetical protein
MSALNCFLTSDAAHVFSDASVYLPTNLKVAAFANKVTILPQYNAVIGSTGRFVNITLLGIAFAELEFDDFDHLASDFASVVKRAVARTNQIDPNNPDMWGDEFTFGLAGWSPAQNAPAFFSVKSAAGNGEELAAVPATKFYSPAAVYEGADDSITRFKFDPDRPGESGLEIMRAQRLRKFSPLGKVGVQHSTYYAIGGWCQHSIISRDGISVKVLQRWPDQIGRTVMPVPVMPGSLMGGTFGGR